MLAAMALWCCSDSIPEMWRLATRGTELCASWLHWFNAYGGRERCWALWAGFFCLQAEDGIRDLTVTGVQTCALPISVILAAAAILVGAVVLARSVLPLVRSRDRVRLRDEPIPDGWSAIVDRNVPLARGLSTEDRKRLLRLIQVFVHDKVFEGCGGLAITDEMKVTIAAHACLLLRS